jgi:tyrosyl-tRNA synthetase
VATLLRDTGLASSLNDARRTIAEGGAYVNNERVTDTAATVDPSWLLHGRYLVLRRGRRNVAGVEVTN